MGRNGRIKEEGKFKHTLSHVNWTAGFNFWSTNWRKQSNNLSCTFQIQHLSLNVVRIESRGCLSSGHLGNSIYHLSLYFDCLITIQSHCLIHQRREIGFVSLLVEAVLWFCMSVCQDGTKSSALIGILAQGTFAGFEYLLWLEAQCATKVW